MYIESLQIKNKYYYLCDDIIYICDFDIDLVRIFKRESKIGVNIYFIGYKPDCDDAITPLYLFINRLFGFIEQIAGSSDRYLVVSINNETIINIFNKLWKFIENKIISGDSNNKIKEYYKLRFDSDLYLPLGTLIEFHSLIINVNFVIEKDNLTIDNIKSYRSFSDNIVVLNMIFSNDDKKNKYHQVWKLYVLPLIMKMDN